MISNVATYYLSPYGSTPFPNFNVGHSQRSPQYDFTQQKPQQPPVVPPKLPSIPSCKFYDLQDSRRKDIIRLMFSYAGVSYRQKLFKQKEWEKIKGQMSLEQLPILRVNKQMKIFYLPAIISYLAREFHLFGVDQYDHAIVDMIVETIRPLQEEIFAGEISSQDQQQLLIEHSTIYLNQLEKFYEIFNRQGPFYLGAKISLADLIVYDIINQLIHFDRKLLDNYSHLRDARRHLQKHPNISRYLRADIIDHNGISAESQRHSTKSSTPNTTSQHHHHRHRSSSNYLHRHHHHHHHHHRHLSKETTPLSLTKQSMRSSKSSTISKKDSQFVDIIPPPPPLPFTEQTAKATDE